MICPKCGKDAGEASFCSQCGENLSVYAASNSQTGIAQESVLNQTEDRGTWLGSPAAAQPGTPIAPYPYYAPTQKARRRSPGIVPKILGMIAGAISVFLGLGAFFLYDGGYESSSTYGGDAYTGIQNAAAQTANNVQCLTDAVKFVGGSVLVVIGAFMILYFWLKIQQEGREKS